MSDISLQDPLAPSTVPARTLAKAALPENPLVSAELQRSVEHFLSYEAQLLDAQDYATWESLFTDGGMYWIPLAHNQADPLNHASICYEDAILRDVRIRRLAESRAWSQQPVTITSRLVGSVIVTAHDASVGTLRVRSAFQMTEWRKRREQRQLAGHYTHDLVQDGARWKISLKRVDLINCDGAHDNFEVFV